MNENLISLSRGQLYSLFHIIMGGVGIIICLCGMSITEELKLKLEEINEQFNCHTISDCLNKFLPVKIRIIFIYLVSPEIDHFRRVSMWTGRLSIFNYGLCIWFAVVMAVGFLVKLESKANIYNVATALSFGFYFFAFLILKWTAWKANCIIKGRDLLLNHLCSSE